MVEKEQSTTAEEQKKERMLPYTNVPLPGPVNTVVNGVGGRWNNLRVYLIHTLPGFVVNHASNFVGGVQMIAEVMMFKASGVVLMKDANKSNPLHYFYYPPRNIIQTAVAKFKPSGERKNWLKPSTYTEMARNFVDLEHATQRDRALGKPFANNLSALSSVVGMTSMFAATILPDRKETAEETQQMAEMAHNSPAKYVGHRFVQAINPFSWWTDKRQLAGLGMVITGVCSSLGAFRQVGKLPDGSQYYRRNLWHAAGSAIMTFAGAQLWLDINNQQGWTNYGTTQLTRLLTLPGSIAARFDKKTGGTEQGAGWYFGAQATMVVKNSIASLLGGAHVKNGEVIDHKAMREQAKEQIREEDTEKISEKPGNRVAQVSSREAALFAREPSLGVSA